MKVLYFCTKYHQKCQKGNILVFPTILASFWGTFKNYELHISFLKRLLDTESLLNAYNILNHTTTRELSEKIHKNVESSVILSFFLWRKLQNIFLWKAYCIASDFAGGLLTTEQLTNDVGKRIYFSSVVSGTSQIIPLKC